MEQLRRSRSARRRMPACSAGGAGEHRSAEQCRPMRKRSCPRGPHCSNRSPCEGCAGTALPVYRLWDILSRGCHCGRDDGPCADRLASSHARCRRLPGTFAQALGRICEITPYLVPVTIGTYCRERLIHRTRLRSRRARFMIRAARLRIVRPVAILISRAALSRGGFDVTPQ